ncbi:MAG: hypothetical protein J6J21_06010 [Clostridia bacterium]|nr:hypothetical protein [Clostridia bacterium]
MIPRSRPTTGPAVRCKNESDETSTAKAVLVLFVVLSFHEKRKNQRKAVRKREKDRVRHKTQSNRDCVLRQAVHVSPPPQPAPTLWVTFVCKTPFLPFLTSAFFFVSFFFLLKEERKEHALLLPSSPSFLFCFFFLALERKKKHPKKYKEARFRVLLFFFLIPPVRRARL